MSFTDAKALKQQLTRIWDRGDLLRDAVAGQSRFPLQLRLKAPRSADITDQLDAVRLWVTQLSQVRPIRVEWQDVRHRVQGMQRLPQRVFVDSVDDAVEWLGKRHDWQRFAALIDETRALQPALLPWLQRRPMQALAVAGDWSRLLAVVAWLSAHPKPRIYLRQLDLPGVHTKLIEAHRGVLAELLDLTLPAERVDSDKRGIASFAGRYGFREKPERIRFRVLDPYLKLLASAPCPDITLDTKSFCHLRLPVRWVFITENETNFLAFPRVRDAIVIFGAGYGWAALASARWLDDCALFYWGDIDTHGFAILNQLRSRLSDVESLLMDRATLDAHAAVWGVEDRPTLADLPNLRPDEAALYDDLRDNRIGDRLRLEQEQIGFCWVNERLHKLLGDALLGDPAGLPQS